MVLLFLAFYVDIYIHIYNNNMYIYIYCMIDLFIDLLPVAVLIIHVELDRSFAVLAVGLGKLCPQDSRAATWLRRP